MIATDIDKESLDFAQENVKRNNLLHLINLKHVEGDTLLNEAVTHEIHDFSMCNPPFFASSQELNSLHNSKRSD